MNKLIISYYFLTSLSSRTYVSWNLGFEGLQKNFSPLGYTLAFVSTMNLTGSVTPVTTKSIAIVTNRRVSEDNKNKFTPALSFTCFWWTQQQLFSDWLVSPHVLKLKLMEAKILAGFPRTTPIHKIHSCDLLQTVWFLRPFWDEYGDRLRY